jgi:hypothetical protein
MSRAPNLLPSRARERALALRVVKALDVADLKPEWRDKHLEHSCDPMTGHCFNATNTFWHLTGGNDGPYKPMQLRHEGASHWFLVDTRNGEVVDLTASQFKKAPDYSKGVGKGMRANKGGDTVPTRAGERIIARVRGAKAGRAEGKASLRLYHGSRTRGLHSLHASRGGEYGPGVYLTSNPDTARMYAKSVASGPGSPIVYVVDAFIESPYETNKADWLKRTASKSRSTVQRAIAARGHDAISSRGLSGMEHQVVVFDPAKVRVVGVLSEKGMSAGQREPFVLDADPLLMIDYTHAVRLGELKIKPDALQSWVAASQSPQKGAFHTSSSPWRQRLRFRAQCADPRAIFSLQTFDEKTWTVSAVGADRHEGEVFVDWVLEKTGGTRVKARRS